MRKLAKKIEWNMLAAIFFICMVTAAVFILQSEPKDVKAVENITKTYRDAYTEIAATDYDATGGTDASEPGVMKDTDSNGNPVNVGGVQNQDWIRYDNIAFGDNAPATFTISYAGDSKNCKGYVEVFIDSMGDTPIVKIQLHGTDDTWNNYVEIEEEVMGAVVGTHNVFLKFTTQDGFRYVANIKSFQFKEQSGIKNAFNAIEAEANDANDGAINYDGYLGNTEKDEWARYDSVRFTQTAKSIKFRYAVRGDQAKGTVSVYLDNLKNNPIGEFELSATAESDWSTYVEKEFNLTESIPVGTHAVYLKFTPDSGKMFVGNIDWFHFGNREVVEIVTSSSVSVKGYQISTILGGSRVIGSAESQIDGEAVKSWGFVYGLAKADGKDNGITENEMYVGSENQYVRAYQSTTEGTIDIKQGSTTTARYFVRTMLFPSNTAEVFQAEYKVRAYVLLENGMYVYSEVFDYSIFRVAENLYMNNMMKTYDAHQYLYNNILKIVDARYKTVDYKWDSSIVKPENQIIEVKVVVVSKVEGNVVSFAWGQSKEQAELGYKYNVYIDNEFYNTYIGAQTIEYSFASKGSHSITIKSVYGEKESNGVTLDVTTEADEPTTEASTEEPTTEVSDSFEVPQMRNDIPIRNDKMFLQLNNKTAGKFSDDKVFWCVLGYNENNQLCYLNADGNLVPASPSMNTVTVNGRQVADIGYSLAEKNYVYLPTIRAGRMYLSYGEPVYISFNIDGNGNVGYGSPDLNNPTDPNKDTLFEFLEFTVTGKEYWGNTTRVDFFSFPMITRLVGQDGLNNSYDRCVGEIGKREELFAEYRLSAPEAFKTLADDIRIMAPGETTFNTGQQYGNYFDNYINEFWNKFTYEDLVFTYGNGTYRGRVSGEQMNFTKDGEYGTYIVYKPDTQAVVDGKGNFFRGSETEKVIESQICAAFNRGVATEPENYGNINAYYKNGTYNYYSAFLHEHSIDNLSYGFCYDDVYDQSSLLHNTNATALIIDLRW